MPQLHPELTGLYCAGEMGDEGRVSVLGAPVLGPHAGGARWLNRRGEVLCQHYGPRPIGLYAVPFAGGEPRLILEGGCKEWYAAGGRWAAITHDDRVLLGTDDDPPRLQEYTNLLAPMGFSWDGWFAYRRWWRDGLFVCAPELPPDPNRDLELEPSGVRVEDVQLHGEGGVSWRVGNVVKARRLLPRLDDVETLPGEFGWVRLVRIGAEWWVAYHHYDTNCVVLHRAADASRGYVLGFGPCWRLDVGLLEGGRVRAVWSAVDRDQPGDLRVRDVELSEPERALVAPQPIARIGRPLWCGFFAFGESAQQLPANCQVPVIRDASWLDVVAGGRAVMRYVAGNPEGDPAAIEVAIARARGPVPVLAYWPRGLQTGPVPSADVIAVEAYQGIDESIDAFEARVCAAVARCRRAVLVCQAYTSNATLTAVLRPLVPVYARIVRDCPAVEGLLVFSAGSRATGWSDHPEIHDAWRELFAGVSTPTIPDEDDMVPKITVHSYDRTLERGKPWQVDATIGATEVTVRIGSDGNLTIAAANAAGSDRTGLRRIVEVQ